MTRAEHTFRAGEVSVSVTVPDGVEVPPWIRLKIAGEVVRFDHAAVRNVRSPSKRKPTQGSPLGKIPADWAPPLGDVKKAADFAPSVNVSHETALFVDWAISKGEERADWLAAWRGWLRRTHGRNVESGWKQKARPRNEDARARWLREHGVTEVDYEARKGDSAWLEMIERRGRVA